MVTRDNTGLQMSATLDETGARYDAAIAELALWRNPIQILNDATDQDPHFLMGHVFKAHMDLVSTDRRYLRSAAQRLQTATALADENGALPREQMHIKALSVWLERDWAAASDAFSDLLAAYPTDMLALWMGHQLDFYLGHSAHIRDRISEVLPKWDPEHPLYPLVQGMHAFGLEEAGETQRALDVGLAALAQNKSDVWSIHAVAHAYEMIGDFTQGAHFMEQRLSDWSTGNFLVSHNAIHTILYRLEQENLPRCLELFDGFVLPKGNSPALLGLIDGSSALWRLFLEGTETGDRWNHLAELWAPSADQTTCAFNDVHAMMAFVASGDETSQAKLLGALDQYLEQTDRKRETNFSVTAEVGRPICQALQAFGRGRYDSVVETLLPIRDRVIRFGGSHAQRDVIERTLLEAAIRSKNGRIARALVAQRLQHRPQSTYNKGKDKQVMGL